MGRGKQPSFGGDNGIGQTLDWTRLALRRTWMLEASRVGLFEPEAVQKYAVQGLDASCLAKTVLHLQAGLRLWA